MIQIQKLRGCFTRDQLNLLIDTHIVVWSLIEPEKISDKAMQLLVSSENEVWVSSLSVWEMVTKIQIGKMALEKGFEKEITRQGFSFLPFETKHSLKIHDLPLHHRDPFDRGLIAQAAVEKFKFLTADQTLHSYREEVDLIMAK